MNEEINLVSNPKKSFWKLSIPIIAFCIFDAIYGIVDMLWVSKISVEAFFALGISIPIVTLIFSFGDSIGQGTNSIMSRFLGSGDYENAYNALIHGMILSNLIWAFIVFCLFFANGILFYLDQANSYILVFDYLVPIVIFAYIFIFVNLFSETFQAEGNSHTPTVLIIASNILNMILDPIFIFNLNLGIKGAAYATVLSSFIVFIVLMYYYISGRTKIPLSRKYFKFRSYILVEIFKVALPNFLSDSMWFISASFINTILITTTGEMGPILYSSANKLKTLLIAPVRGYGRGLMSVTGHLFGAHKFDELYDMFKYVLRVSFITTLIVMIAFILVRDYAFAFFSITGMENEILAIALGGTVIMLAIPFSMISGKMLDGFGKSVYSLIFTFIKIVTEMFLIYGLYIILKDGLCVLLGIMITEIACSILYYFFLRYLFRNFDDEYDEKSTVKSFDDDSPDNSKQKTRNDKIESNYYLMRIPLFLAILALSTFLLEILLIPFKLHDFTILLICLIAFIIGAISIFLMERSDNPKLSVVGFLLNAILIFVFLGKYGYVSTLLFIVAGITIIYLNVIIRILLKLKNGVKSIF